MKYLHSLQKRFTKDESIVIFTILALLLPVYICVPIYLIETIYLFYTKKAIKAFKSVPMSKYLLIFTALSLLVSLFYQNWYGVGATVLIFIMIVITLYYRDIVTKDLFEFILDLLIIMSVLWAIYGFIEYMMILQRHNISGFVIKIYSRPENRLNSVMFNSNYYASAIELIIMMIGYKMFTCGRNYKKIAYYLAIGLVNAAILFLSGCRTSWPAIAVAVIVFLIINKNYKWCAFAGACCVVVLGYFALNPNKIPRIDKFFKNLGVRGSIWSTAIKGIKAHPLFGQGPMTYMMICEKYGGHITQHAHSIYLDPLLSFGIIGVGTIVPYIVSCCKSFFILFNKNRTFFALVISCVVTTLIHGFTDYSVFFVHPGLLFLLITASFSMYTRNEE